MDVIDGQLTCTDSADALANKQDKLTAGQGISIVQKYANELEKVYYDSNGNVLSDVSNYEVKSGQRNNLFVYDNLNLVNKFEFSVRIPTSVLTSSKSQLAVNFSNTFNNDIHKTGIQILKSNGGLTYQMGLMSRNSNWRTNRTFSYESIPDYFDVTITRANASTKILHVKFQCPLDSSAYEFDWDDSTDYGEIFPLNNSGLHLMIAMNKGDPFFGDFSNINFSYASLGELKTTISSTTPITYLTRAEYDALETKDANTMYVITDEEGGGGSGGNDDGSASMPSNKSINLTLGASGSTYTAPANGYYCLRRTLTSAGFQRLSSTIYSEVRTHINGGDVANFLPIKKGATLIVIYDGNYSSYDFRFVYAEGSK